MIRSLYLAAQIVLRSRFLALNKPWEHRLGIKFWNNLIWRFPKIGLPPNHPFIDRIFHEINHPFWGTPHFWKPPYQCGCHGASRQWHRLRPSCGPRTSATRRNAHCARSSGSLCSCEVEHIWMISWWFIGILCWFNGGLIVIYWNLMGSNRKNHHFSEHYTIMLSISVGHGFHSYVQ